MLSFLLPYSKFKQWQWIFIIDLSSDGSSSSLSSVLLTSRKYVEISTWRWSLLYLSLSNNWSSWLVSLNSPFVTPRTNRPLTLFQLVSSGEVLTVGYERELEMSSSVVSRTSLTSVVYRKPQTKRKEIMKGFVTTEENKRRFKYFSYLWT